VARVPAYSPHAVAEHAFALLLAVNRRIHKAYVRVREMDFSLEGLGRLRHRDDEHGDHARQQDRPQSAHSR
jgi:lactate dehydrogenase-like 2-hydroxyacid dehydrogenase